ncbi:ATP-binding protein [Streptantibioticus silvisoli]|uniref:ATP-binding protein n=1 Tax=Streptantibioticus silvisoli TaxID=2705255 RepID=A0ABT6VT29_9ACTN|nr:ATP-binding protein [Streptantibioticus silvisoli]MDI5961625.1 ATP-binding protein [Streptantibioticus silvisoli]
MQSLVNRIKLAATPTAPHCARAHVRHTVLSWAVPHLLDDARLIVSELVTNAVEATGRPERDRTCCVPETLPVIAVRTRISGDKFFIEVWDNDTVPTDREAQADRDPDEGGRGLGIVTALSRDFGVVVLPGRGKIVWSELCAGPGVARVRRAAPTPLPPTYRRMPLAAPRQPVGASTPGPAFTRHAADRWA